MLHLKFTTNKFNTLDNISKQIVEKCKKGDSKAQKELYILSVDYLKLISWKYCPNIHDTQDVIHNAYLKIYKNIKQFDDAKGTFKAWSTKIVINEALQLLKKKNKLFYKDFNEEPYLNNSNIDFDKFNIDEIKKVVRHLKTSQRIIFNMYFFDGYSYAEIASFLNIKESSARGNVSRAKKAFIDIWKKFDKIIIAL